MAERDAAGKARIYFTIYRLNLSFAKIVDRCRVLQEAGALTGKFTRLYQSYAQELQAEINESVVETMNGIESRDRARFEKARVARERELRDPDDVFIHAEERRKELARKHRQASGAKP
jgi:hypothetical protein